MVEKSIRVAAQELKDLIQLTPSVEHIEFSKFSEEYAFSPTLKDKAMLLEWNYRDAKNETEREVIKQEMLELIELVLEDYQENSDNVVLHSFQNPLKKQLEANIQSKERSALVLEGKNLGKNFGKNAFHLQGIDLQLRIGEITGVVGENGNGKTTLFRICVGELAHTEGQLRYPDLSQNEWNKIDWYKIHPFIAYIPQELPKWHGSILNHLFLEATLYGFKGRKNTEVVAEILRKMELEQHTEKSWNELSGGYKLRFSLAKALIKKPRLLVIDEPLANLDINAQTIILNDLKNMVESRVFPVSVLISSQHLHEIERVADNLLFLKEGQEIYNGKTADFGKERLENCFELECNLSAAVFEQMLKGFSYHNVMHNGQVLVVRTPLHITEKELLAHLLAKEIQITYFRNISQSIKKYFI